MSDEKKDDETCPDCGEVHPKTQAGGEKKSDDLINEERPESIAGLEVISLTGFGIDDPITRETVKWVSAYPMMAILRKDRQPIPTMDRTELVEDALQLGLRDKVGIMVLCAMTLRILGADRNTMEGFQLSRSIENTLAMVAVSTGFPAPTAPWTIMKYVEMLNRLN